MLKFEFEPGQSKTYKYASYVPTSYEPFRVHSSLGAAKQSFMNRAHNRYSSNGTAAGKILEMVEGCWYVLHDVPEGCKVDELPWVKEISRVDYVKNPDFISYRETPGVSSYVRREVTERVVKPMTKEEYAEWRIAVDREIRGGSV